MAEYKLTYFDGRGIAEPIRFLFAYGKLKYEDSRIKHEEWEKYKGSTPFGVLPYLEHKGVILGQSTSIARFIGKQVGLGGKDEFENLQIDVIVDTFTDFRLKLYPIYHEKDEEKKKELVKTALAETIPFFMSRFDNLIKKNNGFLAITRLSWADLYVVAILPVLKLFLGSDIDVVSDYPNVKALVEKVHNIPQIKSWIESRPVTPW